MRAKWSTGLDKCKLHHVQDLEGGPQSRDLYLELFMVQKDILALTKKGEASKKGDGGRSWDVIGLNEEVPPSTDHLAPLEHASYDEEVNPTA